MKSTLVSLVFVSLISAAGVFGVSTSIDNLKDDPQAAEDSVDNPAKDPLTNNESALPDAATEDQDEAEDITALVRDLNSDKYNPPPAAFRPGHVTPLALDAKALVTKKNGFSVQLPSHSTVVTPAVHQGRVFVSGGFGSREFYAFDSKTGQVAWALSLDDDGPSTAACEGGICAFNTESCTLFVVQADTGKLLWSHWLGDPLASAPTIANGKVFTSYPVAGSTSVEAIQNMTPQLDKPEGDAKTRPPNMTHAIAAFDQNTGKILWQRWIDSEVMSAPVAAGSELFATSFGGTVYKFEIDTGKVISAKRSRATSAPTVVGNDVYYTRRNDGDGEQAAEGLARESRDTGSARYVQAAKKAAPYLDARVQSRSAYWKDGLQLDADNGFSGGAPTSANPDAAKDNVGQSSVATMQAYQGSKVLNDGRWNYNSMGDEIVCTSAATGERRWAMKLEGDMSVTGGFLAAPPAMADNKQLVIGTLEGELLIIDPDSGKKLKSYKLDAPLRAQVVVHEGWIYAGTTDGKLVAINTGDKTLTGWSQWGKNAARNG